MQFIDNHNLRL